MIRIAHSGIIVNISSVGGLRAPPAVNLYAASKHALEAIGEAFSLEVSPFGIRVLLVKPGAFRTNFLGQGAVSYQLQYLGSRHGNSSRENPSVPTG